MDPKLLVTEIRRRLAALKDRSTEDIRNVRKEFSRQLVNEEGLLVQNLALRLLRHGEVPRFFAYELIQHHPGAARLSNAETLKQLGDGLNSWGDVDSFACFVAGPAWRERLVRDDEVISWAHSQDRWWRRAAVVSTVPLNTKARGGTGDVKRTLMICKVVLHDRDDMVVKALSWALRELAKRHPDVVKSFLSENRNALRPRVLREVTNKLSTGVKSPKTRIN